MLHGGQPVCWSEKRTARSHIKHTHTHTHTHTHIQF